MDQKTAAHKPIGCSHDNQAIPLGANARTQGVRWLSAEERSELRQDMAESSAWAKAELARRRKNKGERS
jgi:hypothetical protein